MRMAQGVPRVLDVGLVGCGGIVRSVHAPAYDALPDLMRVTAVADPVAENRDEVGARFSVPASRRYADYRDMLAGAALDAVVLATPHHMHVYNAVDAASAGVAVISEKPMATSLEESDAILEAVRRAGVPYTVVHNLLFSAGMMRARAIRQQGELGTLVLGRAQSLFAKAPDFATAAREPGQVWRAQRSAGGGCAIDSAYHEVYCLEALVGSPIRFVEARVQTRRFAIDVDDVAMMLFEHESGVTSTVSSAWCVPARQGGRWCEVHGSDGSLQVVPGDKDPLYRLRQGHGGWAAVPLPAPARGPDPTGHLGYFAATFEALARQEGVPVSGAQARHNLAIIEAARRATASRCAVDLNGCGE